MQSAVPLRVAEESVAPANSMGLLQIIGLALLGGLLLNGMPCVLPVLGIKVCSAAELAQRDPSELRRHGLERVKKFTWRKTALSVLSLFESLASEKARSAP